MNHSSLNHYKCACGEEIDVDDGKQCRECFAKQKLLLLIDEHGEEGVIRRLTTLPKEREHWMKTFGEIFMETFAAHHPAGHYPTDELAATVTLSVMVWLCRKLPSSVGSISNPDEALKAIEAYLLAPKESVIREQEKELANAQERSDQFRANRDESIRNVLNFLDKVGAKSLDHAAQFVAEAKQSRPMLLWCPSCGERHVDGELFALKPHHTHACQNCGMTWRPAVFDTVGVQFLPGFKDGE